MKKVIICILIFISTSLTTFAEDNYNQPLIVINEDLIYYENSSPQIKCGTTFVPIRMFATSIEGIIKWDEEEDTATIIKGDKKIEIDFDNEIIITNDGNCIICNMYVEDGYFMIPFKSIASYFGYTVSYIESDNIIRATDNDAVISDESLIEKLKNKIFKCRNKNNNKEEQKVAYLTFDDGPSSYTHDILTTLKKYNSSATFFVLSSSIQRYPDKLEMIVEGGHSIGLHGVSHDVKQIYKSPVSLVTEMQKDSEVVMSEIGFTSNLIRTPYGSFPYLTKEYRDACVRQGYKIWDWNVDSKDALGKDVKPSIIIKNVIKQVEQHEKNNVEPIILMHETSNSSIALPRILNYLTENGYKVISIDYNEDPVNFWHDRR
ncbi:polysaccharide deacetylase family protein [Tepidibacter hydrothermalis]|uniref:Polysaccharide deacetylase family protein n=1 Tax=Tepidibacter hydrothermalis TaxID=3036126 RepID=A0ABY8EC63_9FIRM|nr:polysaccharide deacetylase family protein [Tepidibacter hydrothermalis]WFD10494.1 polysaccharide deacetylase family protein [Tepidibacter hydrothermalis]